MTRERFRLQVAIISFMVLLISGCATWGDLTPDEKARATVDMLQVQLEDTFDAAKAYVDARPEDVGIQTAWDTKIVPAFDEANRLLKDAMDLAQAGEITPDLARSKVTPAINRVIVLLGEIGFID